MSDQRNLIIAIALSLAILLGFQFFVEAPRQEAQEKNLAQQAQSQAGQNADGSIVPAAPGAAGGQSSSPGIIPGATSGASVSGAASLAANRAAALKLSPRIPVNGTRLGGTIALKGGRIDDLTLLDYKATIDEGSPSVTLLSPHRAPNPYYGQFGWVPVDNLKVPDGDTVWRADHASLHPSRPLTLSWDNPDGVRFIQVIEIDDNFMITVTQRVENNSKRPITTHPYGRIVRTDTPTTLGFYILHEGPIGVFNDTLKEVDYDDLVEGPVDTTNSTGGWIGITDKYWLT
ncbi:MAG: membrane protein insertase YidC, partial [Rhodospirillaceae bacterium]|nr:membrane protein insertase YidC [Rhodospirillaceae bacterium]